MRRLVPALALLLFACGGSSTPTPADPATASEGASDLAAADASTTSEAPAGDTPLTEADCQLLFDHVFDVAIASAQRRLPEEERPTAADLATAKDKLHEELFGQCLGATRSAMQFDCAIAAQDESAMRACMGE